MAPPTSMTDATPPAKSSRPKTTLARWFSRLPPQPPTAISGGYARTPSRPAVRPGPAKAPMAAAAPAAPRPPAVAPAAPAIRRATGTPLRAGVGLDRTAVPTARYAPGTVPIFATPPKPVVAMTNDVYRPWSFSVTKEGIEGKQVPTKRPAAAPEGA